MRFAPQILNESTPSRQVDRAAEALLPVREEVYGALRLLDEPGWSNSVQDVVVVLSASRSGSSLLFKALSNGEGVVAPAGEHEPWLFLSGDKFPFTRSDAIQGLTNPDRLLRLLRNDLLVREPAVSGNEFGTLLWNRLALRNLLRDPAAQDMLAEVSQIPTVTFTEHRQICESVDTLCKTRTPASTIEEVVDGASFLPIENPPFIDQPLARRATLEELASKKLVFKSPPDAYRPGMYEQLFPNARITYLHLTRGYVQTVNGLLDGWTKDEIDFISNPVGFAGDELAIQGYTKSPITRNNWCFDLFAGWEDYRTQSILEVCSKQWLAAHQAITDHFRDAVPVSFEQFYTDRPGFCNAIAGATGIDLSRYDWSERIMATEPPDKFRWLKRADLFRNLGRWVTTDTLSQIHAMQEQLGYTMEESTWH